MFIIKMLLLSSKGMIMRKPTTMANISIVFTVFKSIFWHIFIAKGQA